MIVPESFKQQIRLKFWNSILFIFNWWGWNYVAQEFLFRRGKGNDKDKYRYDTENVRIVDEQKLHMLVDMANTIMAENGIHSPMLKNCKV